MKCFSTSTFASILSALGTTVGQTCQLTTVRSEIPSNGLEVALQSFSYCGGRLDVTAYVDNLVYNKLVTLYYTNRQNETTPLTMLLLNYESSIDNSNWESWSIDASIYVDGISQLSNLTYQALDSGQTYAEVLGLTVEASGPPEPSLPVPPAPYATPSGFGDDITEYLAITDGSQAEIAHTRLFRNINPALEGAANGTVVAAQSGPSFSQKLPDYEYNWIRDASLTMDVVQEFYAGATDPTARSHYEEILFAYANARVTEQNDPNLQTGLGEPKFYLDNTVFSGPWGRPQNDGPATAAITLIEFANAYLEGGGDTEIVNRKIYDSSSFPESAPVLTDLLFVASNWSYLSFDLWEEVEGDHFYTRIVQRRALVEGSEFAKTMGDDETSRILTAAAEALTVTLGQFWEPNRQIILYEYGPILRDKSSYLDTAIILGVLHGYAGDDVYGYTDEKVLATAVRIATAFIDIYPIANTTSDSSGNILSPPIGRYPEDVFNGTGTQENGGNPWYLCTAALAEFMYRSASTSNDTGSISVTDISRPFFDYFAPSASTQGGQTYHSSTETFATIISSLQGWGDAFVRTIKYYTPADGHLSEEINRDSGAPQGAADLTWSYASLLTAAIARATLRGEPEYIQELANLGIAT